MNERDSEAVAAMLRARGYRIVGDENDCDILLLNTCSVRDAAEQKAIGKAGYLQQRKKKQPDFVLGILGCMAQNRGAALLEQLPDRMIAHAVIRLVARDVGQHGRIGEARDGRAPDARVGVILGKAAE